MAWSTPVDPVAATSITVAWAVTNVTGLLRWLRGLTGNGDPPGADYIIVSTSTTLTGWAKISSGLFGAGSVPDSALADAKVSKTLANYASMALAAAAGTGFATSFQSGGNVDGPITSDWFVTTRNGGARISQTITSIYSDADTYTRLIVSGVPTTWQKIWNAGNDGAGSGLDADTVDGVQLAAMNLVPSGAIVAFETLAELTAAGAGWARYTAADGRLLIGAGTTFSQTFAQATNYGANWTPLTGATIAASGETPFLVSPGSGGGSTNVNTAGHTHLVPTTTWLPVMRGVIWGRKT